MLLPGLEFGLFIIVLGVVIFLWTWGKKDEDMVFMRTKYGSVFPASARFAKNEGQILILAGTILSIVSLLIRG